MVLVLHDAGATDMLKPPPRILIVDDDPGIRVLVASLLRGAHYEILTARDGLEALGVALGDPGVDVIVTDVQMPRVTGVELGRLVRAARPHVAILYMSGAALDPDMAAIGASRFLAKPFTAPELLDAVRDTLGDRAESNHPSPSSAPPRASSR